MPEAGSDAPQRRRRPRTTKESIRDSVYLVPPSALSRHALGAALAARAVPPRRAADSARQDEDAESFRVRALDGWETRRQREKALAEFIASSDDPGPRLPDDDLLMAVHLHAAKTYERSGLLVPPKKRARAQPWASKKRRLVDAQKEIATTSSAPLAGASSSAGGSGSAGPQAATERAERTRTMTRRTGTVTKSRTRMDGKDHGMDAEDEDEEQDGIRHRSEEQSQDSDEGEVDGEGEGEGEDESEDESEDDNEDDNEGEGNHGANDNDDGTARSQTNTESSQRRRAYKRRDMYRAFDGSALLALGILVEEYIIAQLHQAGYQPRRDRRDDHSDHHPDDQPRGTGLGPRGTGPTAPDAPRRLSPSDSDDANHADAAPLDSLGQASGASDHDESSNDAYDDIRNDHDDESNDDHDGGSSGD